MKIEEKLRAIMDKTGWTQQQLAGHFQVSQSSVNRWLTGSEPEGHRRDAINKTYDELVVERPEVTTSPKLREACAKASQLPDDVQDRIIDFINFQIHNHETRDTAT